MPLVKSVIYDFYIKTKSFCDLSSWILNFYISGNYCKEMDIFDEYLFYILGNHYTKMGVLIFKMLNPPNQGANPANPLRGCNPQDLQFIFSSLAPTPQTW